MGTLQGTTRGYLDWWRDQSESAQDALRQQAKIRALQYPKTIKPASREGD